MMVAVVTVQETPRDLPARKSSGVGIETVVRWMQILQMQERLREGCLGWQ